MVTPPLRRCQLGSTAAVVLLGNLSYGCVLKCGRAEMRTRPAALIAILYLFFFIESLNAACDALNDGLVKGCPRVLPPNIAHAKSAIGYFKFSNRCDHHIKL